MRLSRVLLSMAALVLLSACHDRASLGVKIDSTLHPYIPADTTLLVGVEVQRLTATPFYGRHANQINVAALNQLTEKVGVDPRRDVSSVLFPFRNGTPLILARGRFSAVSVEAHLQSLGATRSEYQRRSIFETEDGSVFFPDAHIAVGGPSPDIRAIIDGRTGRIAQSLLEQLRFLPAADQIWIVSSKGLPLDGAPLRSDVRSALSNVAAYVSALDAGVALDAGAHVHIDLQCDSADGARQVHDALRGGLGLARLTTRDGELALLKLYDAIQITYEQQTVHLRADLSPALADQLVTLLVGLQRRAV